MDTVTIQGGIKLQQDAITSKDEPQKGSESECFSSKEMMTHILNTARSEDVTAIRLLTESQVKDVVNSQDGDGRTVVMLKASDGDVACVRFLLNNAKVLINMQDVNGQTALMMAASHGHIECVTCLLSLPGIDVTLRDKMGWTALMLASNKGHLECVQRLLSHSKLVTNSSDWGKESRLAFLLAVMNGNTDCAKHLMEAGLIGTVNDHNLDLGTAIVLAIQNRRFDCLRYLMSMRHSGKEFGQVAKAIEMAEEEISDCNCELWNTKTMLSNFLTSNINKTGITGLDTLAVANDMYRELYSDLVMVYTMTWCSATVLSIPSQCIYCLCETSESNTQMFKSCIETVIGLAVVNSHLDCVKRLLGNYQTPRLEMTTLGLVIAACKGSVECFNYLLETTVINAVGRRQTTMDNAFLLAASNGQVDFIKRLLDSREVNVNVRNERKRNAFMLSAMGGTVDCVKYLHGIGQIVIDERDKFGNTAFLLSSMGGHVECLKFLLDIGQIDITQRDKYGNTAFMLSAMGGHVECLKFLLGIERIDINENNSDGNTAFMLSARGGHVECLKFLLGIGQVGINQSNLDGNTAFMLSAQEGHVECLKYLLGIGQIDINQNNRDGNTAFLLSAREGHMECVKYLLSIGQIDINQYNGDGNTALMLSASKGNKECVNYLLGIGRIDINQKNHDGNTALMLSARKGHMECLKVLLGIGQVDINQHDMDGNTAFMLSAREGHIECVKYLFDIGHIDINQNNGFGKTAFMLSASRGHLDCVKYLISAKLVADINHRDFDGNTAFSLLASRGLVKGVKYLLENGVNPSNDDVLKAIRDHVRHQQPDCLDWLFDLIPHDQRTCVEMKAHFLDSSGLFRLFLHIPQFLKAGAFHWSWYPEFDDEGKRDLARDLIIGGYAPREFKWKGKTSSPLHNSFMIQNEGLARYLMTNFYLTPFDVENFHKEKDLLDYVQLNGSESLKELHRQISGSPLRLEALSLLKISALLRNEHREKDMERLDGLLPAFYERLLRFKTPFQRLCIFQWRRIEVNYMFLLNGRRSIQLDESYFERVECCRDFCLKFP